MLEVKFKFINFKFIHLNRLKHILYKFLESLQHIKRPHLKIITFVINLLFLIFK